MEDEWGLKLCIGQRDFVPGTAIAENIVHAIDQSRKTILVLTPSFATSEWCNFEMNMALTRGHDSLILIYKETIELQNMSKVLRKLLAAINYIPYEVTENGQLLFWERLKDALTGPMTM